MGKKALCLIFTFLLSINSFAAVVSDNDGSAFITKSEFDSLKNNFQSQIDSYNANIDNKIDAAIASYLAGISVSKDTIYNVEVSEWENVIHTNYSLEQNWSMPSLNLDFSFLYGGYNYTGAWFETWWTTSTIKYDKPSTEHQVRNCVNAGIESSTYVLPDKVVWVGQSADYEDRIDGVKSGYPNNVYSITPRAQNNEIGRYWAGAGLAKLSVVRPLNLRSGNINDGQVKTIWKATVHYRSTESGSDTATSVYNNDMDPENVINNSLSTSVVLNYVDGKQYNNEHIITWENYQWNNLSDPNWSHCLGINPMFTQESMLTNSSVTKSGKWGVIEVQDTSQTAGAWSSDRTSNGVVVRPKYAQNYDAFYSGDYKKTSTENVRSVGVLDKTYYSSDIYQWDKKRPLKRDNTKSLQNVNLCNGALIAYAMEDEKFKWEPQINGSYWDGVTDKPIKKWRVELSKEPFGTKNYVPANTDVLKNKDQTEVYLVTNESGKCKFEFELSEETTIFCKWWPDDTNICDNYPWVGILDLTNCGTYTITKN